MENFLRILKLRLTRIFFVSYWQSGVLGTQVFFGNSPNCRDEKTELRINSVHFCTN